MWSGDVDLVVTVVLFVCLVGWFVCLFVLTSVLAKCILVVVVK